MSDKMIATPKQQAEELHQYILAQSKVMAQSVCEIGRSLKLMRDEKLYLELGHATFEEYTTGMLQLKQRQAYNYIQVFDKLGAQFVENYAQLGVTRLLMLTDVPATEREDFIEANNVEDLTVRELAELTEKYRQQGEQLQLAMADKASAEEFAAALREQVTELEGRPVDVAVEQLSEAQLEAIREEERKRLQAEQKATVQAAVDKAVAKAVKDAEKQREEAEKRAVKAEQAAQKAAIEQKQAVADAEARAAVEAKQQLQDKLTANEEATAAAIQRAAELEERLQLAANNEIVAINLLFEEVQTTVGRIADCIQKVDQQDAATGEKLRDAAKQMLGQLQETI